MYRYLGYDELWVSLGRPSWLFVTVSLGRPLCSFLCLCCRRPGGPSVDLGTETRASRMHNVLTMSLISYVIKFILFIINVQGRLRPFKY